MLAIIAKSVQAWEKEAEVFKPREGVTFTETPVDVDIIIAVEVIEHIEKEELYTLLKKWSVEYPEMALTTPNGDFFKYHPKDTSERRGYHVWHYTKEELYALFSEYYDNVRVDDIIWDGTIEKFTTYKVYGTRKLCLK
jgi:predicted SAM-dependent methyltransferase